MSDEPACDCDGEAEKTTYDPGPEGSCIVRGCDQTRPHSHTTEELRAATDAAQTEASTAPGIPAYDVAYQNAMVDLAVIKACLTENRPLEALRVATEACERHEALDE